jgi:hypothetical protein
MNFPHARHKFVQGEEKPATLRVNGFSTRHERTTPEAGGTNIYTVAKLLGHSGILW